MEIIVELTLENTKQLEDVAANMLVTVNVTNIWREIQKHNRIYVISHLSIPVRINGQEKTIELSISDYFNKEDIKEKNHSFYVIQNGYVEGSVISVEGVKASCDIWAYDVVENKEETI
ncbi:MAG: hypothetical protein Q4G58_14665 [bacterium]|nr:hypothetical protein [bacterium]